MRYADCLRKLYNINANNPVKLGLESTLQLYEAIGRPCYNIPIIHIAGTNGKGSVALKIAESLTLSHIKTGECSLLSRLHNND